jgi:hypothetical protein
VTARQTIGVLVLLMAPFASCATAGSSPAARLHDALPIVAASTRELCKSAGDAVLDALEAHAIDDATATKRLDEVHATCRELGTGLALLDDATARLAADGGL